MRCAKSILGLVGLGLASGVASGQTPTALVTQGDTIIGVGAMQTVSFMGATDSNLWSALVTTSFFDTSKDGCLLRNGFVMLREGTNLFAPPGTRLGEWISINMNQNGDLAQVLRLEVAAGGNQDGIFWNLVPLALADFTQSGNLIKGTPIVSPLVGAGTTWFNYGVVKVNNNNQVIVLGEIVNPAVAGNREDALIRYNLDSQGNILNYEVLATKGSFIDALGTIVDELGSTEHILAQNDHGDFITYVRTLGGRTVLINMETEVAREGEPSSTGANWNTLTLSKVHINNRGDYLVTGSLVNQVYLLEKNGQKFVQAGDVIPSLSAAPLANGTPAPVYVAETGDVFWQARFTGANDECFVRNYEPFIQRNRTTIAGNLVTTVLGDENAFAISANGRFFVGRVQLQPTRNAVAFVDFGLVLEVPGCAGNPGKLKLHSGKPLVGGQFRLALDNPQVPGAVPLIVFSPNPSIMGSPCGRPSPYGEVLISAVGASSPLVGPWTGPNPNVLTINLPNTLSLVNAVFYAQGAFRDPAQPSPEKYRLTNAVRIEFGPP